MNKNQIYSADEKRAHIQQRGERENNHTKPRLRNIKLDCICHIFQIYFIMTEKAILETCKILFRLTENDCSDQEKKEIVDSFRFEDFICQELLTDVRNSKPLLY